VRSGEQRASHRRDAEKKRLDTKPTKKHEEYKDGASFLLRVPRAASCLRVSFIAWAPLRRPKGTTDKIRAARKKTLTAFFITFTVTG
jgi:hypothetical protein